MRENCRIKAIIEDNSELLAKLSMKKIARSLIAGQCQDANHTAVFNIIIAVTALAVLNKLASGIWRCRFCG